MPRWPSQRCGVQNMRSSPWLHPVRNKIIQVSQLWRRRRFDTNWRCALWFELWCDIYEEFWSCYFHLKDNELLQNIVEDLEKKLAKASNLPRPWPGHLLNTAPIRRLVPAWWLRGRLTRFWRLEISCPCPNYLSRRKQNVRVTDHCTLIYNKSLTPAKYIVPCKWS